MKNIFYHMIKMSVGYELIEVGQKFSISVKEVIRNDVKNYIMLSEGLHLISDKYISSSEIREWEISGDKLGTHFISLIYTNPLSNDMPKTNIIKVDVVEEGKLVDLTLYIMQGHITGYVMKGKFYNVNGVETETLMGTTYNTRIIKSNEGNIFNFYLDEGDVVYEAHSCLFAAKNSYRKKCGVNPSQMQKMGIIELPKALIENSTVLKVQMSGDTLIGYEYKGKYLQKSNNFTGQLSTIEIKLPVLDENTTLQLYRWKSEIYYLLVPPCCDKHNCVYKITGEKVGCPSGGISGKGDGMNFSGAVYLSDIQLKN
jgi:hypothetical protein